MDKSVVPLLVILCYFAQYSYAQQTCIGGQFVSVSQQGNPICDNCPEDTYKPDGAANEEDTSCIPCPDDKPRNQVTGSAVLSECQYAACGAGQQYNQAEPLQCEDCAIGFFQDKTYPLFAPHLCEACPAGKSTAATQSTSELCVESCPSGEEYNVVNQACEACALNFYKDNSVDAQGAYTTCVECPSASHRTLSTGATSQAECNIVSCDPGTKTDEINNVCIPCGVDTYQNEKWQTSCNSCPLAHGTLDGVTGAADISQCYDFCPDGKELNDQIRCVPCEQGYFKDNSNGRFENCTICPDPATITAGTGASLLSECIVANCSSGTYLYAPTNTCTSCPKGYYQSLKWQTSCDQCGIGQTTIGTGSEDSSDCLDKATDILLVDMLTSISCAANPSFKDSTSSLYTSINDRAQSLVEITIDTNLNSINVETRIVQFIGFRCSDNILNILLQVQLETTEQDTNVVRAALQSTLSTAMSTGTLSDPNAQISSLAVNTGGITDEHIALSSDLTCGDGRYTNMTALVCDQCLKGSFQPSGVPELCFPCQLGFTTAGNGAFGQEDALCTIPNPDDYTTHPFLLEIASTVDCTEAFTDPGSNVYQAYASDVVVIVTNVITATVDASLRLSDPVVTFVGFRCNSPVEMLLEVIMQNLNVSDWATVNAVVTALTTEAADGALTDPDSTPGVQAIPVNTAAAVHADTVSGRDLSCPGGQQTDLATGQCRPCPVGTYQPEAVPELCYLCPTHTTTPDTGTVLSTGADPSTVCTVAVTTTVNILTAAPCAAYLYRGRCVSACPTGYQANDNNVCHEGTGSSGSGSSNSGISDIGVGVGSALGGLFALILLIFTVYGCINYCGGLRGRRSYSQERFLDSRESKSRDRREAYGGHRDRGAPRDMVVVGETRVRGAPYNPYSYH